MCDSARCPQATHHQQHRAVWAGTVSSGTVFLVLVALIAFGGSVIRGFAWILLIGVVSGTYSTISIVPAVALWWDKLTGGKRKPAVATSPLRSDVARESSQPTRKRRAS